MTNLRERGILFSLEMMVRMTHLCTSRRTVVGEEYRAGGEFSFCSWFGVTDGAPEMCLTRAAAGGGKFRKKERADSNRSFQCLVMRGVPPELWVTAWPLALVLVAGMLPQEGDAPLSLGG